MMEPMQFEIQEERDGTKVRVPVPFSRGGKCSPIIVPGRSGGHTGITLESDDLVIEATSPWNMPDLWRRHPTYFLPGSSVVQIDLTNNGSVEVTNKNWLIRFTANKLNMYTASKGLDVCIYSETDLIQTMNPNAITNNGHIGDDGIKIFIEGGIAPSWHYRPGDILSIRYHQP